MESLYDIPGFNIYLMVGVIIVLIVMRMISSSGKPEEGVITMVTMTTIGISGWFSITNGIFGHILYADRVAESIGWSAGSGFQTELAFALVGIGLVGGLGFWRWDFWLPYIIAKSIFSIGAGITHVIDIIENTNYAPNNAGPVLYWDFIFPVILIGLYILYKRNQQPVFKQSGQRSSNLAD
ncbi:MAG: DUF6790 family protein [Anaerolineales bacterium]